jgi:hypothetical protein
LIAVEAIAFGESSAGFSKILASPPNLADYGCYEEVSEATDCPKRPYLVDA